MYLSTGKVSFASYSFQNCFDMEKFSPPAWVKLSEVSILILEWQKEMTALTWIHLTIKLWSCQNQTVNNLNIRGADTFYKFAYKIIQMSVTSPEEHTKSFLHTVLCFKGCQNY